MRPSRWWVVVLFGLLAAPPVLAAVYDPTSIDLKAARDEQRQEADLKAQQDVAEWAEPMFYATAASVVMSVFALGGLLWSLRQTNKAIKDNRELGEAAVRAYVEAVRVRFSDDGGAIIVEFINMGQTPVTSFKASIELEAVPENAITTNVRLLAKVNMKAFDGIGSGDHATRHVRVEPNSGSEVIRSFTLNFPPSGKVCLACGRIDYHDVFGSEWTTGFAFYSHGGKFIEPFHTLPTYRKTSTLS
ncbi:hypothetical protein [Neorhizobium sp. NCHU2750]|uniref:hypothetical protein n=1 Tax=Neorhizobium sp. NCHU2750 TaxID=1825976 RepID=UPI000E7506C8|nr:hypothetical protein NCHU2750_23630 [Neorhizobium sp. NCHU2750]